MDQSAPEVDVEFRNVIKTFGSVRAVDGISFQIPKGSFYSFLGPSGCGKTSSLRLIGGFEQPDDGEIFIAGELVAQVPPYQRHVNMVFQYYALFPHMNVARNVGYGLRQQRPKLSPEEIDKQVDEALALVRLSGYANRRSWELSGGQQQRVALARALVNKPTVLLLDEPLAALDRKLRKDMQVELKTLQQEVGITFVFVTHDQEEALSMSDRIAVMRDGRIVQEGSPTELYNQPADRYVAGFIGQSNFIAGEVLEVGKLIKVKTQNDIVLTAPGSNGAKLLEKKARAVVAVRPERISLQRGNEAGSSSGFKGRISQVTFLGDQTEYHIETEAVGHLLVKQSSGNAGLGIGDSVIASWNDDAGLALLDD